MSTWLRACATDDIETEDLIRFDNGEFHSFQRGPPVVHGISFSSHEEFVKYAKNLADDKCFEALLGELEDTQKQNEALNDEIAMWQRAI